MAKSSTMPTLIMKGIITTVPRKVTDPRFSYNIEFDTNNNNNNNDVLQTRMHVILCYNNSKTQRNDENGEYLDSGWHVGGWIKETLGKALEEDPILAGRMVRSQDYNNYSGYGGDHRLEIVSNDSGVRVVEAQIKMSLGEFLESKEEDEVKNQLVCWRDFDEENIHFSPLFYIQVTNFQCGGYTIGISYSLLLADPFRVTKFLNRWAEIHRTIAYDGEIPKTPLFYAPNFAKRVTCRPPTTSNPSRSNSKTAIFDVSIDEKLSPGDELYKDLVSLCVEKAEGMFGGLEMGSNFVVITKEPDGDNKVEKGSKKEGSFESLEMLKYEIRSLSWEDLGNNTVAFGKGNLPVEVMHWVACKDLEGVVLVVISSPWEGKYGMKVYVTFY